MRYINYFMTFWRIENCVSVWQKGGRRWCDRVTRGRIMRVSWRPLFPRLWRKERVVVSKFNSYTGKLFLIGHEKFLAFLVTVL